MYLNDDKKVNYRQWQYMYWAQYKKVEWNLVKKC